MALRKLNLRRIAVAATLVLAGLVAGLPAYFVYRDLESDDIRADFQKAATDQSRAYRRSNELVSAGRYAPPRDAPPPPRRRPPRSLPAPACAPPHERFVQC